MRTPAAGGLDGETLTYRYDPVSGLPVRLETDYDEVKSSYVSEVKYTEYGELSVITYNNGGKLAQQAFYYDAITRRLAEAVTVKETAPSTVTDAHYSYTPAGQITKIADTPNGGVADTQCFSHDHLGRTTEAWTPKSGECAAAPSAGECRSGLTLTERPRALVTRGAGGGAPSRWIR